MKEFLNETHQTSGTINLLGENKIVQRTFKLVQPLKRSKVEELFSKSNWKAIDSNDTLSSHFQFYTIIKKFDPFYDAKTHQILTINLANRIVNTFTQIKP